MDKKEGRIRSGKEKEEKEGEKEVGKRGNEEGRAVRE